MIYRAFRYKLSPTIEQEAQLAQFVGVVRLVYNAALKQRLIWWRHYKRETGKSLNYVAQSRELTALRSEFDWIAAVPACCQQQALRDLDQAFSNFLAGRARLPTPRRKGINDRFRIPAQSVKTKRLNGKWSAVWLRKIGWVKFRDTRALRGMVKNVTVARDAMGWRVIFLCEIDHVAPANTCPSVGIDRGIANTLTLSTGEHLSVPAMLCALERGRQRAQRVLTRRRRGSIRYAKALGRHSRCSSRIARIRKDWQHKVALDLSKRFGTVYLEDLKIMNMTASARGTLDKPGRNVKAKARLNHAILNQGWGGFERLLAYKLEERGGALVKVSPAYTSQTCSACGHVDPRNRKNQTKFLCIDCGHEAHADVNAALNILRRNTASMRMEDGRQAADEVRTGRRLLDLPKIHRLGGGC